ncbi:hypothetical protein NM688_g1677 [Phlebia brevispora]|uniref:Uncharacterized protein n=1 Tax=Phlebia brevispora TaxID=194682 RepID=A0ACC1TAH6_9APHY|nr:hypothetical protein NM688_g1677 [Phlebia brevispora]
MIIYIAFALLIFMFFTIVCPRRSRHSRSPHERTRTGSGSRRKSDAEDRDLPLNDVVMNTDDFKDLQSDSGPILFYDRDKPFYEFANFSPHPVIHEELEYPTAEHLFQAHKFLPKRPELAERIRNLPSARAALQEATRLTRLRRTDWFDVNLDIMDTILEAKFTQHPSLRVLLLSTGDREIVEASPVDSFWGTGEDGQGRNELGKALTRLREKFREQHHPDNSHSSDPHNNSD